MDQTHSFEPPLGNHAHGHSNQHRVWYTHAYPEYQTLILALTLVVHGY